MQTTAMGNGIVLTLDAIAHGGEAIGRHGGKAVFVPYAIPGERVRVEIVDAKERWARARLVEVLESSADRVEPPCPYFGPDRCGGCQWQHIAYPRQAELKQAIVVDQLRRLAHIESPPVADIVVLADPLAADGTTTFLDYGYRNHIHLAATPDGQLGFRRTASLDVIAVERCLLLHEQLDELFSALDLSWPDMTGLTLRGGTNTGDALIVVETAGEEQPELEISLPAACALLTPRGVRPMIGAPYYFEEVAGRRYRVSADSFFQVNTSGASALIDVVASYAGLDRTHVLLDAYCGVGLFALALADDAAEVIGIESSPSACEDFAFNAGDRSNVALHEGSVDQVISALLASGQHADVVVLDPPRAGAGPAVIRSFAALGPKRIVYVSCDPATLARDAAHLVAPGYHLVEAQPVDMFPQTYHVETVALWERD